MTHPTMQQPAGSGSAVASVRRLPAFAAIVLTSACSTPGPPPQDPGAHARSLTELQLASLDSVFYAGNARPPAPGADEVRRAQEAVANAQPWERDLLVSLYPEAPELWALAIRDSDGDGLLDFRISDYYGRFLEGDTDLDGDGVENVLDPDPYTAGTRHPGPRSIPEHLSWASAGKPSEMVQIQQRLYEQHQILLVDRSAAFTSTLAKAVYDAITRVYARPFAEHPNLPTLRIIAAETNSLLVAEDEAGSGDFAQVFPATQTMEIYQQAVDAPPVIVLGSLVHELGHNFQFALDYDAQRRDEIMRRNFVPAPNFHAIVEPHGWTLVPTEPDPEAEFTLFRPQYVPPDAFEYRYLGESIEAWEAWLGAIYDEVGADTYLSDPRIVEAHVLGDYSLSSPWEWHSDHLIAYVYLAMLDSLQPSCETARLTELADAFQSDTVAGAWPYFRFANARGAPVQQELRQSFPITPADAAALARDYLLPLHPGFCPL